MGTVVKIKVCKEPADVKLRSILCSISSTTTRKYRVKYQVVQTVLKENSFNTFFWISGLNLGHKKWCHR